MLTYGLQSLDGRLGECLLRRIEQVGICLAVGTADPALELVELGDTVQVRPVYDDRVDVRDVYSVLYDGGGDQHLYAFVDEATHGVLKGIGPHLAVGRLEDDVRHPQAQHGGHFLKGIDPVVQVEHLSVACGLEPDGPLNDVQIKAVYDCFYGFA